jgi:hypothetical protein
LTYAKCSLILWAMTGEELFPGAWSSRLQPQLLLAAVMPQSLTLSPDASADVSAASSDIFDEHISFTEVPHLTLVVEESLVQVLLCFRLSWFCAVVQLLLAGGRCWHLERQFCEHRRKGPRGRTHHRRMRSRVRCTRSCISYAHNFASHCCIDASQLFEGRFPLVACQCGCRPVDGSALVWRVRCGGRE